MKMLRSICIAAMILISGYLNAQVSFTASTPSGSTCAPATVTFTNTSTIGVNYYWYIGGVSYYDANPTHTFTSAGGYYVELYAYDDSWSTMLGSYYEYYQVGGASQPSLWISQDTACVNDNITFQYYGPADYYQWDFGDGYTSNDQYAYHSYQGNNKYYVNLTVYTSTCGYQTLTDSVIVDNSNIPEPIAYNNVGGEACPGENVGFYPNQYYSYYSWDFGDGTAISNNQYPDHVFSSQGTYVVNLTVTNGCGNSGFAETVVDVGNFKPVNGWAGIFSNNGNVCPGEPAEFYTNDGTLREFYYDFGDGSSVVYQSGSAYITHAFPAVGIYEVNVSVTNYCGNDSVLTTSINVVDNKPFPGWLSFGAYPSQVCPNELAQFYAPSGQYSNYTWNFDDGMTYFSDNQYYTNHYFTSLGSYNVSVTFNNTCGNDTTMVTTVNVSNNQPIPSWVNLYSNANEVCPGSSIELWTEYGFTNYLWNFDDGTTSAGNANTSHVFTNLGTYDVSVTFENSCGNDTTLVRTINVTDNEPIPSWVNVNINPNEVCPGQTVELYASYGFSNYQWFYSDGTFGESSYYNSKSFDAIGVYGVSVTFQNGCGNDTTLVTSVNVSNNLSIPSNSVYFNASSYQACPNENIQFYTNYGYTNYFWQFSDGTTDTGNNYISKSFSTLGVHTVSVTFENTCGNDTTLTLSVEINSNNSIPSWVSFYSSQQNVCPGQTLGFEASPGFINYSFNFDDGQTLFQPEDNYVQHSFSALGQYNVSVTFENSCGNDTTLSLVVNVTNNVPINPGNAYINASHTTACPDQTIWFNSSYNYTNYFWEFGDGSTYSSTNSNQTEHSFSAPGIYDVSVTFENFCGNDTTLVMQVNIENNLPVPSDVYLYTYGMEFCPGDQVQFEASQGYKNYSWNFGDGNTYLSSFDSWVSHEFISVGTYDVSVTFENSCGNDTTLVTTVQVTNTAAFDPSVYFYTNTLVACPGDNVRFVAKWGYPQYDFDFGDGNTHSSDNRIAYHSFDAVGLYNVSVTMFNNCGNDTTLSLQVEIKDGAPIQGYVGIGLSQYEACPNENVYFYSNSLYDNHVWDFGDGGQSSSKYASHSYSTSGVYTVSLNVTNACGQDTTIYQTIEITNNLPFTNYVDYEVHPTSICPGDAVGFRTFTNATEHLWSFGDAIFSSLDEVSHTYTTAGTYNVTYTATNGCGNDTSVTFDIIVDANLIPNPSDYEFGVPVDNVCLGDTLLFYIQETSNTSYFWDFGDGSSTSSFEDLGNFGIVKHSYDALGTYNITFTLTNSCGNSFNETIPVVVSNSAAANGGIWTEDGGAGLGFCPGSDVSFMLIGGGNYVVDFNDGSTPASYEGSFLTIQHTFADPGLYNVTAYIYNSCGNVDTSDTEIIVLGNCSQLYASAEGIYPGCSENDGSATVTPSGGTTPYSYLWDNGQTNENAYGLSNEEHFVTVSDNGGQVFVASTFLTTVSQIDITVATTDANCGISNGSATVSVSGGATPYTYNWSNGATSTSVTGLSSGVTVVGVADENGCVQYAPAAISDIGGATVNATVSDVSCFGSADGSIDVTAIGGAAPLFFNWSNGGILPDQNNLTAGSYELVVRDANNCKTVKAFFVDRPDQIEISSTITHASCGSSDGEVSVSVAGGVSPYSYSWANGGTTSIASNLTAGIARVTVTDDNGCIKVSNNVVNNLTAPTITIDQIIAGACSESTSAIYITVNGGATPYSYEWSNGSTTEDIEDVTPSEYALTLTDGVGCVASLNETIGADLPDESPICLVTVDSTGYNQIVWDKAALTGVTEFKIYKESSVAGLYQQIGTQLFTDASVFTDSISNPLQQAFRYKITAVDDCGNETELSIHHKTIHLAINLGLGGSINLIWSNYEGFDFGTYYINRYTAVNGWEVIDSIASNLNSFTDFNPPTADLYYVVSVKKGENCVATVGTQKASQTYNSSRSNQATKSDGVNSLNEWYASFAVALYPNPTDGEFTLNIAGVKNEDVRYSIYDMQGRLVLDDKLSKVNGDLNQAVDLTHVESGIYSVRVMKGNEVINKKLIVH